MISSGPEHDSGRRLRRMGDRVRVECHQPEVGSTVHKPAILGAHGDMFDNWEVRAAAIHKYTGSLTLRARNGAEGVVRRIKNERSSFRENVGADPEPRGRRHADDKAAGRLVNIGFDSRKVSGRKITLRVSVIAVDCFSREPTVDVISVTAEETAGVGGPLGCTLSRGVLGEETCSLQADLRAIFLSPRADSQKKSNACYHDGHFLHDEILHTKYLSQPLNSQHTPLRQRSRMDSSKGCAKATHIVWVPR